MSEYTLTPEEKASVDICEAIKRIWNGPIGALRIGLQGPEIQNAILKILYELTGKQRESGTHPTREMLNELPLLPERCCICREAADKWCDYCYRYFCSTCYNQQH